jgi:pyruvate formate lyase activating enzyme
MCEWIAEELGPDVPLHFTAFHPDFKLTDHMPTPPATLIAAYEIARAAGLHYVYTGNVVDREHQNTYCPACRRAVIERDGYAVKRFAVQQGRCAHCQTPIAGRFDAAAGEWGNRRMTVEIAAYAKDSPEGR